MSPAPITQDAVASASPPEQLELTEASAVVDSIAELTILYLVI